MLSIVIFVGFDSWWYHNYRRYIAEIAPPSIRGRLIGFYEIGSQGAQMCGFWVNYVVNRIMDPRCMFCGTTSLLCARADSLSTLDMSQWQVPLGIQLLPAAIMMVIVPFCPESPRWLCKKDRWEETESTMCRIRQLEPDHPYMMNEMRDIRAEVEFQAHIAGLSPTLWGQLKELTKKGVRNRVGIGLCLMM